MSLFNTNKNNKDKKKGASSNTKPGLGSQKGKTNTKAVTRNTKLTGGSQRGS